MRILIAGATGAIGVPLVRALVASGHEVTGTSRRAERAAALEALGATPAVMDALDREATAAVVEEARPDVIVHQLTALPNAPDLRQKDIYEATDRLRREGTRNLVSAALEAGVSRMVAQSIAFIYASEGNAVKSEDAPVATEAPRRCRIGFPSTRARSGRKNRCAFRASSPGLPPARWSPRWRRRCEAPRTPRERKSSDGPSASPASATASLRLRV